MLWARRMTHPFDRYADITDVAALKEATDRPLRKCVRINGLKTSVEKFRAYAAKRQWNLKPVPWCEEGFFIDREDFSKALGRDVLHLLGHFYMQEASSMLPAAMLQPKPGESILDLCAAPGSKTTQIASAMEGRGVLVANDVQEKRLWTLKSALQRSGVSQAIVMKKVGQWYAKQMTERFDRVLCDAPCTAQGTARKDSDALKYGGDESVGKMSRVQQELLESSLHALKVGGRLVYSTCTLTPEENEGVVSWLLQRYDGRVKVLDPRTLGVGPAELFDQPIVDSQLVQSKWNVGPGHLPLLRLWPQTYDTEGFFCAVFEKTATTRAPEVVETVPFRIMPLPTGRQEQFARDFEEMFGSSFLRPGELLLEGGNQLMLTTAAVWEFPMPGPVDSLGLPWAKRVEEHRVRIVQEMVSLRGHEATKSVVAVTDEQVEMLLDGKDLDAPEGFIGDVILKWGEVPIGTGVVSKGRLLNRLSRWVVQRS